MNAVINVVEPSPGVEGKRRRTYGTGSVSKSGGRFVARLRLANGSRMHVGAFDTEAEAEQALLDTRAALEEGKWTPGQGDSLRAYGDQWLDKVEKEGRAAIQSERGAWGRHMHTAPFIDAPLGSITRQMVKEWISSLLKKKSKRGRPDADGKIRRTNLSWTTVKRLRGLLSSCFRQAVEDGLVTENPLDGVRLPKRNEVEEKTSDWTFLESTEISVIQASPVIPAAPRTIYLMGIFTGTRKGELWGLKRDDCTVTGDRPHIMVRRSNRRTTKNGKKRRVPLLPMARQILEDWLKIAPPSREGWVFPRKDGKQRTRNDDGGWRDQRRKRNGKSVVQPGFKTLAGITRRVRFHDLRHTCASHLIMGTWGRRWTLEEVKEFLGHSSIAMTQIYAHMAPGALQDAAANTHVPEPIAAQGRSARGGARTTANGPLLATAIAPSASGTALTTLNSKGFQVSSDLRACASHGASRRARVARGQSLYPSYPVTDPGGCKPRPA